jgi:uncharacterized damage-inducible protein DinB
MKETLFHLALYTEIWRAIKENPDSATQYEAILEKASKTLFNHPLLASMPDKKAMLEDAKVFAKKLSNTLQ